jgi:hypothetical protein
MDSKLTSKEHQISSTQSVPTFGRPRAFDTIFWGGLVAGLLDSIDADVAFGLNGMNPIKVLQFIASGLLGPASFKGGLATAALGAGLHFLIAFVLAGAYYSASLKLPALYRQAIPWGLTFGVVVYFFMNYLVLPFSAVPRGPFSLPLFVNGVVGHAIFVGLPIAWFARRSAEKIKAPVKR